MFSAILSASVIDPDVGLRDLGYFYDEGGVLRTLESKEKFTFLQQDHYDKVGDAVAVAIQKRLVRDFGFQEVPLPAIPPPDSRHSSIWISPDFYTNSACLLVLLHGSGAVRGGQWARSLCINDSLATGSMLPYVARALQRRWAVLVCDANVSVKQAAAAAAAAAADAADAGAAAGDSDREDDDTAAAAGATRDDAIPGSEDPRRHVQTVFADYVTQSPARCVLFVAHSAGGYGVVSLLNKRSDALRRVTAVAFTDSAHKLEKIKGARSNRALLDWLKIHARNWVRSSKPLDAPQPDKQVGLLKCYCLSVCLLACWFGF